MEGFFAGRLPAKTVAQGEKRNLSPRRRSAGADRRTNPGGRVTVYLVMHGARPIDRLSQVAGGNSRRDPLLAPGFLKGPAGPLSRAPRLGTFARFHKKTKWQNSVCKAASAALSGFAFHKGVLQPSALHLPPCSGFAMLRSSCRTFVFLCHSR